MGKPGDMERDGPVRPVRGRGAMSVLWCYKGLLVMILTPILLSPLVFHLGGREARCAYVVGVMGVYWMTEVVPLSATALMPIFLFPALGVLPSKTVAINYMKDTNFLFIGGLIIAVAVELTGLHQRIALSVLLLVGSKVRWLMLGFMLVTWFLSMWISNTATTAMMMPIALAVLVELIKHQRIKDAEKNGQSDLPLTGASDESESIENYLRLDKLSGKETKLCRCLLLAIAYAANIGGTGTLTGTPPNIVMTGIMDTLYGQGNTGVSFASWMTFSVPGAVLNLALAWLWLQLAFLGWRVLLGLGKEKSDDKVKQVLIQRRAALGSITWGEGSVLFLFMVLVVLWMTRAPGFVKGWGDLFKPKYMTDAVAAIFISFFLFFWPMERPSWLGGTTVLCNSKPPMNAVETGSYKAILDWGEMQRHFPWGVVILLGGGFALGDAVQKSGLSNLIGKQLESLSFLSDFWICLISIIMMTFVTEVTSNTATASIFIPILSSVAERLQVNPLYFVLAITVCASFAFMLPVATPPNAIVFGAGLLRVADMMAIGFVMNWLSIGVMTLSINTWTYAIFDLGTYPAWAPLIGAAANVTTLAP